MEHNTSASPNPAPLHARFQAPFHHRTAGCPFGIREFRTRFTSTPRGARLARRLAAVRMDEWGLAYDGDTSRTASLLVAELANNAVTHGHVPGRDFGLRLALTPVTAPGPGVLRIEVSDARGETSPGSPPQPPAPGAESGRGLLLVAALAARWGVADRDPAPAPGKTVWAELELS
jgi:anti-sigma regulatory factor (Ser/Thr protein kinase)